MGAFLFNSLSTILGQLQDRATFTSKFGGKIVDKFGEKIVPLEFATLIADCGASSSPAWRHSKLVSGPRLRQERNSPLRLFVMNSLTSLAILVLLGCTAGTAIAADCFYLEPDIVTSDIVNAANGVANNLFDPPLEDPLALPSPETLYFPGTKFCISNGAFGRKTTHIKLSDIAFAVNDIVSQCCHGIVCQGGSYAITGDNGVVVLLKVFSSDRDGC